MSSLKRQVPDAVVTQSVLKAELGLVRSEFTTALNTHTRELRKEMHDLASEVANTILEGVQRMFDEQNRQNDEKFATKVELKTEISTLREEFKDFKTENLNSLAEIMGELKAIREEQTVGGYRQARHSDQLGNHEQRLKTVEMHLRLADK